ncbi:hypothetical protein PInf_005371 [Phytophthora infestans]|nr:hypothetical protein PInf_005371 [Phytophthora infestans]
MHGVSDAIQARSKWESRASFDPFNSAQNEVPNAENRHETAALSSDQDSDGKENRAPLIGHDWAHSEPSSLLGKRPAARKALNASNETKEEEDSDEERAQRNPLAMANAMTHFEARALALHAESLGLDEENLGTGSATMLVDDFSHIGQIYFGSVPLGERRSRQLTLENANEVGNARVKYEGYAMSHNGEASAQRKTRFKCDLHVCVVDALKSVTLRVTFEPLPSDVGKEVAATLKFTVNDSFKLQCRATGFVMPRVARLAKFGKAKAPVDTIVVAPRAKPHRLPRIPEESTRQGSRSTALAAQTAREGEPEQEPVVRPGPVVGGKRPSSVAIEFSPPRNGPKRRKSEPPRALTPRKSVGASQDPTSKKRLTGSWWKQRQEVFDDNWMAKQTQGFTKWINYVLLDGTAQRLGGMDDDVGQTDGVKRRFDFSSLRVLAQKRMESKWTQAALELYHSPSMDDILESVNDEIGNKGLLFRADRPVYADVGLQEELISLLNNYHPVWLCLGLNAVLGSHVMRQEKCSLRAVFRKDAPQGRKMPQVLRRIILKHLVKDVDVAQNYRLVKILMTPMDGSTADRHDGGNAFTNTKKNINGREYFDSLTQSFMLKFLMLVIFLDRAIERKADKFPHFPCLFRVAPLTKETASSKAQSAGKSSSQRREADALWVKRSQVFVTEFCRLFLASEGRIDKHLRKLGYTLKHEQTSLDEIDLEVQKPGHGLA